ncbi:MULTISPECIES: MmgE/PrpD family protein [Ramlibacter]|uniref:MmgE/PrpD family protein n=1 Tax=Ramlibacter pinisoli TaxID=2682844 RepID=A0A6N8ITF7_9BURK|nr:MULTISPECIES: MmgE/PrpD family protein [Ramlibacter]MBA2965037.1 MmgE/PrpD family protein [Ramlibacter sp. CGMCC 1.13660]MVQ30002.1 MmgE/PrpD family protein [Ramlibacter pinisoli]
MKHEVELGRGTAHLLADRIAKLELASLSLSTLHAARRCVVDVLGCAAAGRRESGVTSAATWARATYPAGLSTVWFLRERLSPVGAAFINASAASILDLDDGHRVAAGHPGAAIVPAVLAAGEASGAGMQDMLLAIAAGYEAGVACAQLRSPAAQSTVATGRWSTIGVAAALAKLMGLDTERMRHALTLAESHAPNLLAADYSGFQGGHVKEGIPWSVVSGFAAAELAAQGFRGYDQALSNPTMYRAPQPSDETGAPLIESTYYKRFACCRWMHSAIDAALDLKSRLPVNVPVQSIAIDTFARAATLPNQAEPRDLIAAQFSVPFAVAAAWLRGAEALLPMDESLLADAEVTEFARRIHVNVAPALDAMYPLKVPARVTVQTPQAQVQAEVISPVGDYDNPLADTALLDKAVHLAGHAGVSLPRVALAGILSGEATARQLFETVQAD